MDWFRMYTDVLDDPRIQRLPGELVKAWLNLLCIASQHDPRWRLPSLAIVDFQLRNNRLAKTRKLLDALVSAGLLDFVDGSYGFGEWSQRQAASQALTNNATARQRTHRAQKRTNQSPRGSQAGHATVTPRSPTPSPASHIADREIEIQRDRDPERDQERAEVAEVDRETKPTATAPATASTPALIPPSQSGDAALKADLEKRAKEVLEPLTPGIREMLAVAIALYRPLDIAYALDEAERHNKRNWAYVETILKRRGQENGDFFPARPSEP